MCLCVHVTFLTATSLGLLNSFSLFQIHSPSLHFSPSPVLPPWGNPQSSPAYQALRASSWSSSHSLPRGDSPRQLDNLPKKGHRFVLFYILKPSTLMGSHAQRIKPKLLSLTSPCLASTVPARPPLFTLFHLRRSSFCSLNDTPPHPSFARLSLIDPFPNQLNPIKNSALTPATPIHIFCLFICTCCLSLH